MKLKKIFFVLPNLGVGGAERVLSYVAQHIDKTVFDVKLLICGFKEESVYPINGIEVVYFNKRRLNQSVITLFKFFLNRKPDIIMSTIGHVNILMGIFSIFLPKIKFVGREASVISKMLEFSNNGNNSFLNRLIRFSYPKLTAIVCQSEDMKHDLVVNFKINPNKLHVINNPITEVRRIERKAKVDGLIRFITVGSLVKVKGHLRILKGLSTIKSYDFRYLIIGEGNERDKIRQQIAELNLIDKVDFINHTSDVLGEVGKADYFLQGSYVEGFPNALLESCSVGTPVIAFNCLGGTKSIVKDGLNGFLVNDETHFETLLNSYVKLMSINSQEVVKTVINEFSSEKIIKSYENMLVNI